MKGFIIIGRSTYQMVEIFPSEMDDLLKTADSQLWPLRFDCRRRIFPAPADGWKPLFYEQRERKCG